MFITRQPGIKHMTWNSDVSTSKSITETGA